MYYINHQFINQQKEKSPSLSTRARKVAPPAGLNGAAEVSDILMHCINHQFIKQQKEKSPGLSTRARKVAPPAGLEPATYGLTVRRSTD